MGVKKREYPTQSGGIKKSKYWSYEFFIDKGRFQGTIDDVFARSANKDLIPEGKKPEELTKKQAEAICDALKEKKERELSGTMEEVRVITFDEIAMAFYKDYLLKLNARRARAPHKNIRDYYNNIIMRLQEHFGGMAAKEIGKTHIAAFKTKRRQAGVRDKTIRNDILALSSIFTHAADEGACEEEEVPQFRSVTKKLKKSKQRERYLSEREYDLLVDSYDKRAKEVAQKFIIHGKYKKKEEPENPYNVRTRKRIVMFDVEEGLRREELLTLLEDDCNFIEDKVKVRETKNGTDREIPLSLLGKQLLQEQLQEKRERGIVSPYMFCKSNGKRFSEFRKGFKADCERAGIKNLIPQDLRRTFGSWQLQGIRCKPKRIEEVSKLLGHSDISITQRAYAFLDMEKIKLQ